MTTTLQPALGIIEQPAAVEYRMLERFPGYRFGSDGSVWSCLRRRGSLVFSTSDQWRRLKCFQHGTGYTYVSLRRSNGTFAHSLQVHRLILEAFVGPCPPGMEARHFPDNNRSNNAITNLLWGTHFDNLMDKVANGTMPQGERHHESKLNADWVRDIRWLKRCGMRVTRIARLCDVALATVQQVLNGETWRHVA